MQPFTRLTSRMIPLLAQNVDTDQIIPARYLKVTDKSGLEEGLFYSWRYRQDGYPKPDFPLNQAAYQGCQILLAGDNFGCGSSREHAPWALIAWGIRAVISTTIADIFRNNALKNGLLPVQVDAEMHQHLVALAEQECAARQEGTSIDESEFQVCIDLEAQSISIPDGLQANFPIDAFSKTCLLNGVDSLGYLLNLQAQISAYEKSDQIYPVGVELL
jgi:3-isopropylmalate/(R)-2-methylmalate dehydratase small subunit